MRNVNIRFSKKLQLRSERQVTGNVNCLAIALSREDRFVEDPRCRLTRSRRTLAAFSRVDISKSVILRSKIISDLCAYEQIFPFY